MQLKVLLSRQLPNKVKDDPSSVEQFFDVVLDSHIVAAALVFFGMDDVDGQPTQNVDLAKLKAEKWGYLSQILQAFINQFIPAFVQQPIVITDQPESHPSTKTKRGASEVAQPTHSSARTKKDASKVVKPTQSGAKEDYILNYACNMMGHILLARNFRDAARENDGARSIRCWKFFLLHYRAESSRSKYAIEAFHLLAQINALLSPRMAHELIWNRTVNVNGGAGNNIPMDLHLEHLNRVFKDNINTFRAHISEQSVQRSSRAIAPVKAILEAFDKATSVKQESGHHTNANLSRDFNVALQLLRKQNIFKKQTGRSHNSFKTISSDPLSKFKEDPSEIINWIKRRVKAEATDQDLRSKKARF